MAKARILVIEDEAFIAANIEGILERNGYFCAGLCRDGAAAEACLRATLVDAVLLDVLTENNDPGYALCSLLAALGVPFAFVTAVQQNVIPEEWRDRPYCGKPFGEADILGVLADLMRQRGSTSEQEENGGSAGVVSEEGNDRQGNRISKDSVD